MTPKTFIFSGRSGCGKGTQVDLLIKKLQEVDSVRSLVHLETGKLFREFIKGETYTQKISNKIYDAGGLQPEFLTISLWANFFIGQMKENVHLVVDGTPRKHHEAIVLDSAMKFYKREKPFFVHLNVSRKWAEERLLGRHRVDDNKEDILARLDWYDTDVVPAIQFYKNNPDYVFLEINGEQTVEDVHKDILKTIFNF